MKLCAKNKLTKKEAQEHLNHLKKKGHMKYGRIYPCTSCVGFWHITHAEFRKKEEREVEEYDLSLKEKWKGLIR